MSTGGWERPRHPHARDRRVSAVIVIGAVALAVVLLRPAGSPQGQDVPDDFAPDVPESDLEITPDETPGAEPPEDLAHGRTVLTPFDPITLEDRADVVELAATSVARSVLSADDQVLLLHHYDPTDQVTRVQIVRGTLGHPAAPRELRGVVEMLSFDAGARAIVWVEGDGDARRVGRWRLASGRPSLADDEPANAPLPPGFDVVELHGLRAGRVAAYGRYEASSPEREPCRVLVLDVRSRDVVVDRALPSSISCGSDAPGQGPREHPGMVWDADRERLHLVRVTGELLTIDLREGTTTGDDDVPDVARGDAETWSSLRTAVAGPGAYSVVSTGSLDQLGPRPFPSVGTRPLEPVLLNLDDGHVFARGEAAGDGGRVVAVGEQHAALADESSGGPLSISLVLLDLVSVHARLEVERQVIDDAAFLGDDEWLAILSRDTEEQRVTIVEVASGEVIATRSFHPRAEVHLRAGLAVEHERN